MGIIGGNLQDLEKRPEGLIPVSLSKLGGPLFLEEREVLLGILQRRTDHAIRTAWPGPGPSGTPARRDKESPVRSPPTPPISGRK